MKIFVTGCAGFIGSHLIDRLIADGFEVAGVDNLSRGKSDNISEQINSHALEFNEADIRDFETISGLMKGCEVVFHLAAQSNVMGAVIDLDYSFQSNVIGTYNVLKAARANKVKRLIFSSSREVYGEAESLPVREDQPLRSKNFYGASKVAGEKYCEIYQNMKDIEIVILRLSNVYGLRDFDRVIPIFISNMQKNQKVKIYGGKQVIDFISIELVVEALVQSIDNEKAITGATNIGSGVGTTLFELANRIQEIYKSGSEILVEPARNVEVVKYIADIKRMCNIFDIMPEGDPLYYIKSMVDK